MGIPVASEKGDIRKLIFKYRSYTPIPFLMVMVVFARPTFTTVVGGLCIVCVGEWIRFWGVSIVGSETRTTGTVGGTYLVTTGPFAYIRNPLYVGNMLVYAGVGLMSHALFPWLVIIAMTWFYIQYSLIVTTEEEYLAKRFGDSYRHYTKHVPRFFPRLKKYRSATPPEKTVDLREGLMSERRTLQAISLVALFIIAKYIITRWQG